LKITILGSGTSHGVPMIGCDCDVCRSTNPKNKRFRSSIVVTTEAKAENGGQLGEKAILVDTTPELRMQSLAFDLRRVDVVLFTHTHSDHIMGLDDLRRFNDLHDVEIPVYGDEDTLQDIRRIYPYIFRETQTGGGKPRVSLHRVEPSFALFGLNIQSFYVMHGRLPVLAYRFDQPQTERMPARSFAYVTDVNHIPDEAMQKLHGLDLLVLDAVRYEPHPTHFGFYQALDVIAELQPRQALLTHLSHHFDHEAANALAPANVQLAYDGQIICL
jgi:phosphoribosyl 1,2-cyclic phosphate phosphodiesterase